MCFDRLLLTEQLSGDGRPHTAKEPPWALSWDLLTALLFYKASARATVLLSEILYMSVPQMVPSTAWVLARPMAFWYMAKWVHWSDRWSGQPMAVESAHEMDCALVQCLVLELVPKIVHSWVHWTAPRLVPLSVHVMDPLWVRATAGVLAHDLVPLSAPSLVHALARVTDPVSEDCYR
jgi:hypothetical protein